VSTSEMLMLHMNLLVSSTSPPRMQQYADSFVSFSGLFSPPLPERLAVLACCWYSGVDLASCPEARLLWHLSHDLRWILERSQVTPTNPLLHMGWRSSLSKAWQAPISLEHVLTCETWGLSDGNAVISQECCQSYMIP